jgi:hypothetical protein
MRCVPNAPFPGFDSDDDVLRHALDVNHTAMSAPTGRTDLLLSLPAFDARLHYVAEERRATVDVVDNTHSRRGNDDSKTNGHSGVTVSCPDIVFPSAAKASGYSGARQTLPIDGEANPTSSLRGTHFCTMPMQNEPYISPCMYTVVLIYVV